MSCPTLPFFSVGDRTIGVRLCKCKQNKLFIFLFNNQIYGSLITLAIERKPFELFGYNEAIRRLEPTHIIRYGEKMPEENEEISTYFENENYKKLKDGRKR